MKIMTPTNIVITDSNVAGSIYSDWNSATAYAINNSVYLPSTKGEYQALTVNTNKQPDLNPTDWKFLGTTNKYKMFDQFLNTQTVNSGSIVVDLVVYGANGIYLGNLDAISVEIDIIDNSTLDVIESALFTMYRDVSNWQDYYFGNWIDDTKDSIMYERTTLTQNISALITIDNGLNDAKCGIYASGTIKEVGQTRFDAKVGALDYSSVAVDSSTGATYLNRGNYAKTLSLDIFTHTQTANYVFKTLSDARGTPLVFIGGVYDLLSVYGYIQKYEELVRGPVETAITVDVIGLI